MKRNSNTSSLKEAIDQLMKVYRLGDKMLEIDVVDAWNELMGEAIAKKTDQVFVRDKVLYVKLNSAALREELSYGKQKIINNINEHIGKQFLKDVILK